FLLLAAGFAIWMSGYGSGQQTKQAATGTAYDAISKLPDWSGVWLADAQPNILTTGASVPLTPEYAEKLSTLRDAVKTGGALAGNPSCKPYGMPLSMSRQGPLYEFLFMPGHVIVNMESFETRDIFINREPPDYDFDRFNGTALGHWEDDTLVVE